MRKIAKNDPKPTKEKSQKNQSEDAEENGAIIPETSDHVEEHDISVKGIIDKLKYQSEMVTLTEWNSLLDLRIKEIENIGKSQQVVDFFSKWSLYTKDPEYVRYIYHVH